MDKTPNQERNPAPRNSWAGSCRRKIHQQSASHFTSVKQDPVDGSFLRNSARGYFTPRFFSRVWGGGIVNWVAGVPAPRMTVCTLVGGGAC